MKLPRSKVQYGQLDESSRTSTASLDFISPAAAGAPNSDHHGKVVLNSGVSPTTAAIAIGLDGQIVNPDVTSTATDSIQKKSSTSTRRRRKNEMVMGWQRNPKSNTKQKVTVPPPPSIDEERPEHPRQSMPHVRPKRSRKAEQRRIERKEIIMGWQRNPPAGGANIAMLLPVKMEPQEVEKSIVRDEKKMPKDEKESDEKARSSSHRHRDPASPPSKKGHHHRSKSSKETSHKKDVLPEGSNTPQAGTSLVVQSPSSSKPVHLRVQRSTGDRADQPRSRTPSRRTRKLKEETTFQWTRENGKKEVAVVEVVKIAESDRVDKSVLGEVTKILERQKKYEQDKREAIGMMRGRRYRSGGPITRTEGLRRAASSRSPGPAASRGKAKEAEATGGELHFTWRREPPQRSKSASRRRLGRTSSGDGMISGDSTADAKARRRPSRTHSGGNLKVIDGTESRSRRRSSQPTSTEKEEN